MTGAERVDGPPSSAQRAPWGWVWRFYLAGHTAAGCRTWARAVVDVASLDYRAASEAARRMAAIRGVRVPLVLGVKRLRPAEQGFEPDHIIDLRRSL